MKAVSLELYKLRHKKIFLMVILFLLVEIAWVFMATSMAISRNPDIGRWEPLIAMWSHINGLFLPILIAICVSRICDMEHKGNTWKLLLTISVRRSTLYGAKYISASIIMLVVSLLQVLAIIGFGIISGFKEPVPLYLIFRFLIGTLLTNMIIIALQQWISMTVKNQAFALSLGMIGGFIGLTADLFPFEVRRIFLWSYYTGLSPITESYVNDKFQFIIRDMNSLLPMMRMLVLVGIVIYLVGCLHVSRQEV